MSKLYLVPTPIGNLKDITFRALEVLESVGLILAEDTRQSGKLLKHYKIHTPVQSHHMFNEHKKVESICLKIESGTDVALISDGGTPGISDPGFLLVRTCLGKGIEVETLPGPAALIPAVVNSGLPCERFCFEGFLPARKGRSKRLAQLVDERRTMIFYESPFRLVRTLDDFVNIFGGEREASVSRELSKLHEETIRGNLVFLSEYFCKRAPKGEIVVVVTGKIS